MQYDQHVVDWQRWHFGLPVIEPRPGEHLIDAIVRFYGEPH